jgi:hypothetical protein
MTNAHISMSPHELAELALLDAYGLLEAADQIRFEQAFLAISPDIQAEIRRIQTDIVTDETLLPNVTPPAELKAKVLERIYAATTMRSAGLVGIDELPLRSDIVGHIGPGGRILGSVWTWRMAALVLLGVCLTLIVMVNTRGRHFDRVFEEAMRLHTEQQVELALGTEFQPYMELMRRPTAQHHYLAVEGGQGMIRVSVDETRGDIFLLAMDLGGQEGPCAFTLIAADGTKTASVPIRTDRYLDGVSLSVDPALLAGATFELRDTNNRVIATNKIG